MYKSPTCLSIGLLSTKICYKPTNTYSFLTESSHMPTHIHLGIAIREITWLATNTKGPWLKILHEESNQKEYLVNSAWRNMTNTNRYCTPYKETNAYMYTFTPSPPRFSKKMRNYLWRLQSLWPTKVIGQQRAYCQSSDEDLHSLFTTTIDNWMG